MDMPRRILVADDESAIIGFITEVLHNEGYNVCTVKNGESALQAIQVYPPDLVILDHSMPGMTGGEVLAQLRAEGYDTPIIMMSAYAPVEVFLRLGATAYLDKPFDIDKLLELIDTHVRPLLEGEIGSS